jgi:hypothetical protein
LPRSGQKHGIRIHFAPRGCEADELLEEMIRDHATPRALMVVSSDHRIQRAARCRRAKSMDSDRWVAEFRHPPHPDPPASDHREAPSPEELQAWLDEFSDRKKN